ncbi:MAG: aminotransferase class I/II-fold pyridoxal phosphate-dependent enzyme, partial [Deltaproteobacteria bacterium]|nr:aminotransferase class I/II-fold pyridoxal phosphate-dependent enzyme [Deltaproteobacteria bacterium]
MSEEDQAPPIPAHIRDLAAYQPGRLIEDVIEEMGLPTAVKLASNENSLGPSPLAVERIGQALWGLARYGDADSRRLREAISRRVGHPAAGVMAGNGSSEFILVMAHALLGPGLSAIMSRPSFTLYAKNAQAAGARAIEVPLGPGHGHDLEGIMRQAGPEARLVFIDNPLNPTGAFLGQGEIERLLRGLPRTAILVLDEAYADFARAPRPDYGRLLADGRVVILRTFSKVMGLAGLRAAYALAAPPLAQALNKVRQPFNLNNLAQVGAMAALEDEGHVRRTLEMTWAALDRLGRELPPLGLEVFPTQANFVMAGLPDGLLADDFAKKMLKEGVIVRSLSSFGLPGHVRINAGLEPELEALLGA